MMSSDLRGGSDKVLEVDVWQNEEEEHVDSEESVQVVDKRFLVWHYQHVDQQGKPQECHCWIL